MNIKKIEKQLKKINQLFENIKEDGTVSAIEKDLMLSYVRALYEKMLEPKEESSKKIKREDNTETKDEAKTVTSNPVASAVFQEIVEKEPVTPTVEPVLQTVESKPVTAAVNEPVVADLIEEIKPVIPEEILELFQQQSGNELSDKLSRAPISDLTKCMGINEKIFTVQELFGGDSSLFTNAMETMDKFTSLEQARDYLVENVAVDQNWASEGKLKKASNFIKLISRRY